MFAVFYFRGLFFGITLVWNLYEIFIEIVFWGLRILRLRIGNLYYKSRLHPLGTPYMLNMVNLCKMSSVPSSLQAQNFWGRLIVIKVVLDLN